MNNFQTVIKTARNSWGEVRWKMLVIFAFFSVISTFLVTSFSAALLNVVIRRESTYLIEERINGIVDNREKLARSILAQIHGCEAPAANSPISTEYLDALWPGSKSSVTVLPKGGTPERRPVWLNTSAFSGIVVDRGSPEIRSLRTEQRQGCSVSVLLRVPLTQSFAEQMTRAAGLHISNHKPRLLRRFHPHEEVTHVIEANLIPGSTRTLSAVVTARNWQTGLLEDWELCQVRPSYSRLLEDLSHVGMRTATWVSLLGAIAFAVGLVYAFGFLLSVRLSQRIVATVDDLTDAALRVGKGDFSVRLAVPEQDQLGMLASSFNNMTQDLETLRQQEKQNAVLERDMALAYEVQQYLYPPVTPVLSGAHVWGVTTPARMVSGDLYDCLSFSQTRVGLLCADVSGKGISAGLMMAHLQAVARGRLLSCNGSSTPPVPDAFVTVLNRDLQGRFGNNRYATMFYGDFDSTSKVLRYVNAGHCPPILISDAGEAIKLRAGDLPVGLFPDAQYQELRVTLSNGCAVVVYTDGVTDAVNSQGEEFGETRLMSCCASLPKGANAKAISMSLSRTVAEWADGVEQFDDTTILVLSVE